MIKYFLIAVLLNSTFLHGQIGNSYIHRSKECMGGMSCNGMSKLTITSDSSLIAVNYGCTVPKRNWKKLAKQNPEKSLMKIEPLGKFQLITDMGNDSEYHVAYIVKIKSRKILFYLEDENSGKYRRVSKYRIFKG
ncbi:MAG: hypothetical protein NXI20_22760 [bacterium]|nr:hypothetical protein [bacterium]